MFPKLRYFTKSLTKFLLLIFLVLYLWTKYEKPSVWVSQYEYDWKRSAANQREMIFVGGSPSSGTTLARFLLDVHPQVNCGLETRVIAIMLKMLTNTVLPSKDILDENIPLGIRNETVKESTAFFIQNIMEHQKKNLTVDTSKVRYLCNKEPSIVLYMRLLNELFPKAKFVYMIRDGRDASYSFHKRVTVHDQSNILANFTQNMINWNRVNTIAYQSCIDLGPQTCHMVRYERLVNERESVLRELIKFLDLPWTDDLLHHDDFEGKIVRSSGFFANFNVSDKINNESVGRWRGKIPNYDEARFVKEYPMLKVLGYV